MVSSNNISIQTQDQQSDLLALSQYYPVEVNYINVDDEDERIGGGAQKQVSTTTNPNLLSLSVNKGIFPQELNNYVKLMKSFFRYSDFLDLKIKIPLIYVAQYRGKNKYYIQRINYIYHFKTSTQMPSFSPMTDYGESRYKDIQYDPSFISSYYEAIADFIFLAYITGIYCQEFEILYSPKNDSFYAIDFDHCGQQIFSDPLRKLDLYFISNKYKPIFLNRLKTLEDKFSLISKIGTKSIKIEKQD